MKPCYRSGMLLTCITKPSPMYSERHDMARDKPHLVDMVAVAREGRFEFIDAKLNQYDLKETV